MHVQVLFVFILLTKLSLDHAHYLGLYEYDIFTRYFWIFFFPPKNIGIFYTGSYTEYFYCYTGTAQTQSRLLTLLASGLIPSLHI